jgi:ferritin
MGAIQSQKLIAELQSQVMWERFNADVYLSLSWQLDDINLPGMAKWMKRGSKDERHHADMFAGYLSDRFTRPVTTGLQDPTAVTLPDDPLKAGKMAFEGAMAREQFTTGRIDMLSDLALEENDPMTSQFLLWFEEEQKRSEREIDQILTLFVLADGDGDAILRLDHKLGKGK